MKLKDAKQNQKYTIISNNIIDQNVKIRLMELGLYIGQSVMVIKKTSKAKNLLIAFNNGLFTLDGSFAELIEVGYA